jgi:hypothetical protein
MLKAKEQCKQINRKNNNRVRKAFLKKIQIIKHKKYDTLIYK